MAKAKTRTIVRYAKRKTRRKKGFTLPIAVLAGFVPGVANAFDAMQTYGVKGMGVQVSRDYLGFDPQTNKWYPGLMWGGTFPLILGIVVHKVASVFGVNRALGRANIPFIRI